MCFGSRYLLSLFPVLVPSSSGTFHPCHSSGPVIDDTKQTMHTPEALKDGATPLLTDSRDAHGSDPPLPPPPAPSADPGLQQAPSPLSEDGTNALGEGDVDIFTLSAASAMKMLCNMVESLVRVTGDVPPTPPISLPTTPVPRLLLSHGDSKADRPGTDGRPRSRQAMAAAANLESVPDKAKTPIGSPESGASEALQIVGANMEPLHIQHGAISRKFFSKKPPPISLEEYLSRLHLYCPMSTAVYLATGLYIHKLAVIEKILPVTTRNVHRLLLAGLRVAMKALEDLSYPHSRFAKVGGVSEAELGRLEISFCFVTNFELRVTKEMLFKHMTAMRDGLFPRALPLTFQPRLPAARGNGNAR